MNDTFANFELARMRTIHLNKQMSFVLVRHGAKKKEIMRPLESFFVKQIGTTYNLAIMEIMNSKNVFAFQLLKAAILS